MWRGGKKERRGEACFLGGVEREEGEREVELSMSIWKSMVKI